MEKMTTATKKDLVDRVAAKHPSLARDQIGDVVQSLLDETVQSLAEGQRIEIRGFGVLSPRERKARKARNPKTGVVVDVPPSRTVNFRPGKDFKDKLAGKPAPATSETPSAQ